MYSKSKRAKWQKFANYSKVEKLPSSSTDWGKYAFNSFDPNKVFNYTNKVNRLILNHPEWEMLNYAIYFRSVIIQFGAHPIVVT